MLKLGFASFLILPVAFGQISLTTAQIAKRVSPAVVVIQGKTDSDEVQGSGFITSKDGMIVTNLHVIKDLRTAKVHLADGKVFDSIFVLATDERRDLAIIKVAGFNLDSVELGNSDTLTVGEPVIVVGSPLGLEATVTAGILSAIRDSGDGYKLLQTDAAVNHGNSGGPLVADNGTAVGVVSSIVRSESAQGLNFAIPINYVRELLNHLHAPVKLEEMPRNIIKAPIAPATPPAPKQNRGPSLTETLNWLSSDEMRLPAITHYVASYGDTSEDVTLSLRIDAFENPYTHECPISIFQDSRYVFRDGVGPMDDNDSFSGKLDYGITIQHDVESVPMTNERRGYMITIAAQTNVFTHQHSWDTFKVFSGKTREVRTEPTNKAFLVFGDESIALRVRDALVHAVDLCRKKEPF